MAFASLIASVITLSIIGYVTCKDIDEYPRVLQFQNSLETPIETLLATAETVQNHSHSRSPRCEYVYASANKNHSIPNPTFANTIHPQIRLHEFIFNNNLQMLHSSPSSSVSLNEMYIHSSTKTTFCIVLKNSYQNCSSHSVISFPVTPCAASSVCEIYK